MTGILSSLCMLVAGYFTAAAEPVHYPPTSSHINNLTFALTPGLAPPGIYNSSETPDSQYGTYNWCNMPHVRPREYKVPPESHTLQYVEIIQRHHKRTPYATNIFFKEDVEWTCVGSGPTFGSTSSDTDIPLVQWQSFTDSSNPWTTSVGPGFVDSKCQFPQITDRGLEDSIVHGKDLRAVYAARLGLSPKYDPALATIRVTNNIITSQVASGLVAGLFPNSKTTPIPVLIQSSIYDSLEPKYPCHKTSSIRIDITTGSQGSQWKEYLSRSSAIVDKLDKVSGFSKNDTGWHDSLDHYYDNLSAKQCHGKALPHSLNDSSVRVTQEDADMVYRLGNWEYSYLYRDAPASITYSALKYGAWLLELKKHLEASVSGGSKVRYYHSVAHDGSISSLLGFLQIDQMVWPGMGSEVIFELYSFNSDYLVRVLWGGQPMQTSTPLGVLDMIPLQNFFKYIDSTVGSSSDLIKQCNS